MIQLANFSEREFYVVLGKVVTIHIISRKKTDSSWPLSVWVVKGKPYKKIKLKDLITKIGKGLKRKR